ncbi:cation diffusion facilitator family transporter [Candidatus Uhrbacteria bacterium]|nr:cation diffusion facilitator family transporter [Candidatus Uhrbacteria bacterium]
MSPYITMTIVLVMYVVKAGMKLTVGAAVDSPVLTGDGAHNAADFVEAALVLFGTWIASRPPNGEYPFGWRNIEHIASALIGIGLGLTAMHVAWDAVVRLSAYMAPLASVVSLITTVPPRAGTTGTGSWIPAAVAGGSALVSVVVGRYEVTSGRRNGRPSIVADGEETLMDGGIEAVACIGLASAHWFGAPWIEYPLALFVACIMAHTAWEIGSHGIGGLLQRSIGSDTEQHMRDAIVTIPGILDITDLRTFFAGGSAVVIAKISSRWSGDAATHLKEVVLERIAEVLVDAHILEHARFVRFVPPDREQHRVAVALVTHATNFHVASTLATATHLRICDIADGAIERWKDVACPERLAERAELLAAKRVQKCLMLMAVTEERQELGRHDIALTLAPSHDPVHLGHDPVYLGIK